MRDGTDGAVKTLIDTGMNGQIVEVECPISNDLPATGIVGSISKAIDEAKERLCGAFSPEQPSRAKNALPINLSPGDLQKIARLPELNHCHNHSLCLSPGCR